MTYVAVKFKNNFVIKGHNKLRIFIERKIICQRKKSLKQIISGHQVL